MPFCGVREVVAVGTGDSTIRTAKQTEIALSLGNLIALLQAGYRDHIS